MAQNNTGEPTAKVGFVTEADHEKAVAEAFKAGAEAERARVGAILNSPEAKGREALAAHYAFATDDAPDKAAAALKAAPAAAAVPAVASIADRAAETVGLRRAAVGAAPDAPKQAGAIAILDVVAQINAENNRALPNGRRR